MKIWYLDLEPGTYTTRDIVDNSNPKQTYNCVYLTLRNLGVKKVKPPKDKKTHTNEVWWVWKGADYYLKKRNNK